MSNNDWEQPPRLTEAPREFLVSVELYVSTAAASGLRKPANQRRKPEKRDAFKQSSSMADREDAQKKVKEKGSWMSLARGVAATGHWRPAVCKLSEDGERCVLNVYIDESILYQTVYVHLLNHTDIRQVDTSLFFRKDCVGIYCAEGQRWSSGALSHMSEPLYLQFENADLYNTWLVLLRSYAIPEIYGRWFSPEDGGLYRIWRQVELTIIQGRNLGNTKSVNSAGAGVDGPEESLDPELDSENVDLDIWCDILINDIFCGRTTVKKSLGPPDWQEHFVFADLPPFKDLEVLIWREKRPAKPVVVGSARITLLNFRRGDMVEGWFPVLQPGPLASNTEAGDLRMRVRVQEEMILPSFVYSDLLTTLESRNILDWTKDLETKMQLKNISSSLISIAIAKNVLIEHIFEVAEREVDETPQSHNTLFRGNTILTKTMELCMTWYGKDFLEASIGSVIRRLCAEKIAIEVDPIRVGKASKDIDKNVELLIYWCREFWQQIYGVRADCPHEMRRLFEHIRKLVEKHYQLKDQSREQTRELHWQSVTAFCFLRFIVPGILHPHLYGLCPGLPSSATQRSLRLIAKVIQSLANLNASGHKEEYMRGINDFIKESLPAMVDYILVVSTPVSQARNGSRRHHDKHSKSRIVTSLQRRQATMSALEEEAIPTLPHVLDVPRQLAVISSAVIRNEKGKRGRTRWDDAKLHEFREQCFEVEDQAFRRVSQVAAQASLFERRPSDSVDFGPSPPTSSLPSSLLEDTSPLARLAPSRRSSRRTYRPSTAPTGPDVIDISPHTMSSDPSSPSSPDLSQPRYPSFRSPSYNEAPVNQLSSSPDDSRFGALWALRKHYHEPTSTSSDSYPSFDQTTDDASSPSLSRSLDLSAEMSDDAMKKKRGLLRGILAKR